MDSKCADLLTRGHFVCLQGRTQGPGQAGPPRRKAGRGGEDWGRGAGPLVQGTLSHSRLGGESLLPVSAQTRCPPALSYTPLWIRSSCCEITHPSSPPSRLRPPGAPTRRSEPEHTGLGVIWPGCCPQAHPATPTRRTGLSDHRASAGSLLPAERSAHRWFLLPGSL